MFFPGTLFYSVRPKKFWIGAQGFLILALLLWIIPVTQQLIVSLDQKAFYALNGTLTWGRGWQSFWGALNHKRENLIVLVLAIALNLWGAVRSPMGRRWSVFLHMLYFWLFFEVIYFLKDSFFIQTLGIQRWSPSLLLKPVIRLSEVLEDPRIKDLSKASFPGGHALFAFYWALLSAFCLPKRLACLGILVACFLCVARLISGAHWLSDILFSGILGWVLMSWAMMIPLGLKQLRRRR